MALASISFRLLILPGFLLLTYETALDGIKQIWSNENYREEKARIENETREVAMQADLLYKHTIAHLNRFLSTRCDVALVSSWSIAGHEAIAWALYIIDIIDNTRRTNIEPKTLLSLAAIPFPTRLFPPCWTDPIFVLLCSIAFPCQRH